MSTDKEQLETLLILKYNTFNDMFDLWLKGKISLTQDEKTIMVKHIERQFHSAQCELKEEEPYPYASIDINLTKD